MNKGDIFWARMDPVEGQEQGGTRPVVIVSGNLMNEKFQLVWIIPVTSKIKNIFGALIVEPTGENGLEVPSEVLPFQIRSISKLRLINKIGKLTVAEVKKLNVTILDILRM